MMVLHVRGLLLTVLLPLACTRGGHGSSSSIPGEVTSAPTSAQQHVRSCEPPGQLTLRLERTIPVPLPTPPIALAAIDDSEFFAVSQSGTLLHLGAFEGPVPLNSLVFAGVGPSPRGVLAFTDREIFRVRPGEEASRVLVDRQLLDLRVVSGENGSERLWVIEGEETNPTVFLLHSRDGGYSVSRSWEAPGNWRLAPLEGGEAMLVSTRPPFQMVRLLGEGGTQELGLLETSFHPGEIPEGARIFASAVTPIDCGAVLVTLADIRTTDRWLLVVDAYTGEILKRGHLLGTIGFFGSEIDAKRAFAFRGTEGLGEVLIYKWSWSPNPVPNGAVSKE